MTTQAPTPVALVERDYTVIRGDQLVIDFASDSDASADWTGWTWEASVNSTSDPDTGHLADFAVTDASTTSAIALTLTLSGATTEAMGTTTRYPYALRGTKGAEGPFTFLRGHITVSQRVDYTP